MSRKYKFYNKEGLYFVSFALVYWIDVFVRPDYCQIVIDSFKYCQKHKGMELYGWCIMPSHIHLIFRASDNNPDKLLGRLKEFTSKKIQESILNNSKESRKDWLIWMFERAAHKSANVSGRQFWQHNNKPIELWTPAVIDQKLEYIHQNPVEAGFVDDAENWRWSSARDYAGGMGLLKIDFAD